MPKLTIIANVKAKSDKIDFVKRELEKLIPTTRAENGCLQYDLHQDNNNPGHFLFFENSDTRTAHTAAQRTHPPSDTPRQQTT